MIRINLLKSHRPVGTRLIGRREAILGAALLALACVSLFYVTTRSGATRSTPKQLPPKVEPPPPMPVSTAQPAAETAVAEPPTTPAAEIVPPAPAGGCTVTAVGFESQVDGFVVTVRAGVETRYKSFELDNPNRLVVDLPGCQLGVPREQYVQNVGRPPVERVRVSLYQESPPVVRLVVDWDRLSRYQIRAVAQGLEVRIPEAAP